MSISDYEYPLEQCDVPEVRRASLAEYRIFRRKCLEYLNGEADTSVQNQVYDLAWHTAVFKTLNEARRLEHDRAVNGAMWELIVAGYASLMTLGIRRLVDRHPGVDSVWNVVVEIEKRPELLTREKFVCYDGLPYDYEASHGRFVSSLDMSSGSHPRWVPTKGPDAWGTSEALHRTFDDLCGRPSRRKRTDTIEISLLHVLKAKLSSSAVKAVCTLADKRMAHAERLADKPHLLPRVTYDLIDEALETIVRVANFLSSHFFYDATFGSVVAIPQFDVLDALDQPWVTTDKIPALHRHWREISDSMDRWAYDTDHGFLPVKAGG